MEENNVTVSKTVDNSAPAPTGTEAALSSTVTLTNYELSEISTAHGLCYIDTDDNLDDLMEDEGEHVPK